MAKYVVVGVVIVLGAFVIGNMGGCGGVQDRVGVVADKALKEIDKLIGNLDIQRKKVERKFNEVQVATRNVGEQYVRFEVQHKRELEKQEKLAADKAAVKSNLEKLKGLLDKAKESGSTTYNNQEVTADKLKAMAADQLQTYERIKTQSKQVETTVGLLKKNVDHLALQKNTSEEQLTKLSAMIKKIDGQIDILKAQRTAESIGSPDKNINTGFEELQESVDKLSEDLEVQMAVNDEKLEARIRALDSESGDQTDIDAFLNEKDDVSTTLSDIDKALNDE